VASSRLVKVVAIVRAPSGEACVKAAQRTLCAGPRRGHAGRVPCQRAPPVWTRKHGQAGQANERHPARRRGHHLL
jgi:hypothetical protein